MLNELFALSNTISEFEVETKEWHREYQTLPKAPCFRIWISTEGHICGIDELDNELIPLLRKYGKKSGTAKTFPAFNIVSLYRVIDEGQKRYLDNVEKGAIPFDFDKIKEYCQEDNWVKSSQKCIDLSLEKIATEVKKIIEAQKVEDESAFYLLAESIGKIEGGFRTALENFILSELQQSKEINALLKLLFYKGNQSKIILDDNGPNLSVILDLFEYEQFEYPIASEYSTIRFNDILLRAEEPVCDIDDDIKQSDAYGFQYRPMKEPMPSIKLKGFDVTLRSMFSGQPCQYRYRKIEDSSFPIAKETRSNFKKAFEWLAQDDKENQFWKVIDKNEIIFSYPTKIGNVPLICMPLFMNISAETQFVKAVSNFINVFTGMVPDNKPERIQIFFLRKMDRARTKIIHSRNCTPIELINCAEEWQKGCGNLPDFYFKSIAPFPLEVANIINNVWKRNGSLAQGESSVKRIQKYQGTELLLDVPDKNMMGYYMHIIISHSCGLFLYTGNYFIKKEFKRNKTDSKEQDNNLKNGKLKDINLLLSVMGLLLYKYGKNKEDYMEQIAFQLGQFLKISDEIHAFYCKEVRKGDVPTQLAGNSMLLSAIDTPITALVQLGKRINPYYTWAKQYRTKGKENSGLAGWYISLYEKTADKLKATLTESIHFNDFDKAQLLIGYMASFPKKNDDN